MPNKLLMSEVWHLSTTLLLWLFTNNYQQSVPYRNYYYFFIVWILLLYRLNSHQLCHPKNNCKNNREDTFMKRAWHQMTVTTTTTPTSATITRIPLGLEPTAYYACCCCLLLMIFILMYSTLFINA